MQTCYSINYKDHYLEADQNTIFNVSPLFLHSSENTLISNWTWQWAYPLSRCCKRKDSSRNKTARGPVPVAWGVHSIGPRGPKYLNSWPVLWYLNCILQKPTVQMGTALSAAAEGGGGREEEKEKSTMMRNFEGLTIPRGSLKPDLPSLESVVTAQHRCWVLASLLSTMGHLHHKMIFVSEFIFSCCFIAWCHNPLWQQNFVQSN